MSPERLNEQTRAPEIEAPGPPVDPANGGSAPAPPAGKPKASGGRMVLVNSIIAITTVLLVVGMFSVWANRLLFSPDNWSRTSTQLLANPTIRATTANYLVDQLYANVDVPG